MSSHTQNIKKKRILLVCANADKLDNFNKAVKTCFNLFGYNCSGDEFYVCNRDVATGQLYVPASHVIKKWFGKENLPKRFEKKPFDAIIMQGCMVGGPFAEHASVFYDTNVYNEIFRLLSHDGYLVITRQLNKPIYDGRGIDITPILDTYFDRYNLPGMDLVLALKPVMQNT
jgi:hypothetical protein